MPYDVFKGHPPDISGPDLEHFEKTKHDKTSVRSMKIDEFLIFEKKFVLCSKFTTYRKNGSGGNIINF